MRKFILEFLRRGFTACGMGPVILAILYLILQQFADLETLTANQVSIGILSITALAFIAGGMNTIYQIERLPLMLAILVHGGVLYFSYLCTYLLNDWLGAGVMPIIVFSAVFVVGYVVIWVLIYSVTKRYTKKLNMALKKQTPTENKR